MSKTSTLYFFLLLIVKFSYAQQDTTAVGTQSAIAQDDPAQFLTRVEVINELQHFESIDFLNVTTIRSVIALGKKFTTRFDIPIVYNSHAVAGYDQYGLGDISVRLLGYKFLESQKAALLASVEFSFNTAQSPLLGSGKNIVLPVLTFSHRVKQKTIFAISFQEYFSLWGDESRKDVRWTKIQFYYIRAWSRKLWTLVLPEFYLDHNQGSGASMDIEASLYYRFTPRFAIWGKGGVGLFGEHPARYEWTAETGLRYMMLRKPVRPVKHSD